MIEQVKKNKIELVLTSHLVPYARNSRTHSEEQIGQIAASIREFGFTQPILIDEKYQIIAGHGRLAAAKKLEMSSVPCIILKGLSEMQKKALVIADNKIAENAGWDDEMLSAELAELDAADFDLDLLSFSEAELAESLPDRIRFDNETDDDDSDDGTKEKIKKYILQIDFPDEHSQRIEYEKLKSSGLIVRYV